jgi:predicted Zn-dependent protease
METLKRTLIAAALATGTFTTTPVLAADPAVIEQLVQQAQFWDARNRPDLARDAWAKVLEADRDNVRALERLVDLEARTGNAAKAAEYESRLRIKAPQSEALRQRAAGIPGTTDREATLTRAREFARAGQADEAIAAYRPLLDERGQPPRELALEYYETLAGTRDGWDTAREALRRGEAEQGPDSRYALAHARVLTYRTGTRREGISRLEAIGGRAPALRAEARTAQRNALVWLQATSADRPYFERFLAGGADPEISAKLAGLADAAKAQARATDEARRAQALRAGYDALEAGDVAEADRFFSERVRANAADADARAGLGLVRLRQQRFADAETELNRAVTQKPSLRGNLTEALGTSRYWRRVNEGRAAQQRGNWRTAASAFEGALAQKPYADPDVRRDYAVVLREMQEPAKAERVLRDGLKQAPDAAPLIGELGDLLLSQGKDAEAEKLVAAAERVKPGSLRKVQVELLRTRAAQAMEQGDRRRAETLLQQALAADAQNPWVRLDLARLYRGLGRTAEADTLLQSLVEAGDARQGDAQLAQAYALSESQRWYDTLVVLERVPLANRDAAATRLQRGAWIRYQLQRAEQAGALDEPIAAVDHLNAAIAAAGDDPEYASAIAQGWRAMGDPARAVAALRQAFARRPPGAGDSIQYAALLLELGQDAEFEAVTTSLIQSNTMTAAQRKTLEDLIVGYRIKLADRLRERGQVAEAYTQLREVVLRYPDQPRVQTALSRLFVSAGDTDKALAIANSLMRTQPEDPSIRLAAIDAALAANDRDSAARWLAEARDHNPDDPAVDRAAARLAEQRGNRAESLRLLRRAADLEDREHRDSMMPVLVLIDPDSQSGIHLPAPVRELLQDEPDSIGPLLPRAGDDGIGPSTAAPVPLRHGSYRLDGGFAAPASRAAPLPVRDGGGVALRLDERSAARAGTLRSAPSQSAPAVGEDLRRLEASVSPWMAASFASRSRRGEAGLSRLQSLEIPFDFATPEWEAGRIGVRAKPVVLDAGAVSGRNKLRYGTLALINGETDDIDQSADGVALALDYDIGELSLDIGTTPLGFPVENIVGGLRWQTRPSGSLLLSTEISRRVVTDSLLSYAGAFDPLTGRHWGGVVRTGGRVDIAYDLDRYGLYGNGAWYGLGGRNVEENTMLEFGGGLFFRVLRDARVGDVTVGLNLTSFGYEQNLRHFTLGHGGYFSPQFFTAVTVPVSWTGRYGQLSYRVDAAIGLQSFREDGAPLYPGRGSLQQELEDIAEFEPTNDIPLGYASQKNSGLGYRFGGTAQYRVSPRLSVGGVVSLDNARDYEESQLHVYLRYYFNDRDDRLDSIVVPDLQRGALP